MRCRGPRARMRSFSIQSSAAKVWRSVEMSPSSLKRPRQVSVRLSATLKLGRIPSLRFSPARPIPFRKRRGGVPQRERLPPRQISPSRSAASPKIARSVCERPAPSSPARPRISPSCSVRSIPCGLARPETCLSCKSGRPLHRRERENTSRISHPAMARINPARSTSCIDPAAAMVPSRSTVYREQRAKDSSKKWLM